MLESINLESNVAVFAQIKNEIRFAIASGTLKAGDKLPAVRTVSETLGVNLNTVAKAYRDLEVMGLVYARRGMGNFVCDGVEAQCQEACYATLIEKMHDVVSEAKATGMDNSRIKAISEQCFASKKAPYDAPPSAILSLAKKNKLS